MNNKTFGCAAVAEVLNAMMWKCINLHLFKSCAFQARFTAFAENYEYIQRENAKGYSYKLGLNEFSDMSMDEFKMSKLGMMPESMWGNVPSGGVHKVSNASLPKSVDWRKKAVTPVKNQQQCGSCFMSGAGWNGRSVIWWEYLRVWGWWVRIGTEDL